MTTDSGTLAVPPSEINRIAFLGTPVEAAVALRALAAADFDIATVVTQPDRRRGRGSKLDPSPVKAAAIELGLPVAHDLSQLREPVSGEDPTTPVAGSTPDDPPIEPLEVDLGVVVAYGRIIPVSVLSRVPMVNIHFSLLPRWRGAAPVERAILAGDTHTGVCLMEVAEGLDEGGIYAQVEVEIGSTETATDLRARLAQIGADLLVERLRAGLGPATPQVGETTYAAKLDRGEFRLRWDRPAEELVRVVRLGRAWATFRDRRLGIEEAAVVPGSGPPGRLDGLRVATPDGCVELRTVKPEGRRAMAATDWSNGVKPEPGECLG